MRDHDTCQAGLSRLRILCWALLWLGAAPPAAWSLDDAALAALLSSDNVYQQTRWAARYANAEGVPRSYDAAVELYCRAAQGGSAEAHYRLGWLYAHGRGVPRDEALAAAWFRKAAQQGDRHARKMLGLMDEGSDRREPQCILSNGLRVLPPLDAAKRPTRELIAAWVTRMAPAFQLDPALVNAVILTESNYNPRARSPKGAKGLMQLMPDTARRFGVQDIWRPSENLRGGMTYLRWLLDRFDGNVALALAGYNAGEDVVDRYRGVPPYQETRRYVRRISRLLERPPGPGA